MALAPAGTATGSLGVSATPGGSLLAGWVQGPPPMTFAGGPPASRAARRTAGAQAVMVDGGSFASGFRQPVRLSGRRSGSVSDLMVTLSAPDVGYAVWEQPSATLRLSVLCSGRLDALDRPLFRDAVPLALFPLAAGRAALVFDQYGHGTPFLNYTILSGLGRAGSVARIGHPGTRDSAATELSVNPSGELIASWVHNELISLPGTAPGSRRFVAAKLIVVICKPALSCAAPQAVSLGRVAAVCVNPAVAISPDGTTTVIAAADDWGASGCDAPLGIRAAVTHGSSTSVRPTRLIQREGDFPAAVPAGDDGTALVFNAGLASSGSFAWSFVAANGMAHRGATLLDDGGWWNTGQQALSPANDGWYLITWSHANRRYNPQVSIRAALGHNDRVGAASVAVSALTPTDAHVSATDGRGDAIVLFSGSTDTGNGATWPYSSGLYATVRRP